MPVPCFAHVDVHGPYEQTKHLLRTAELYLKDERSILFFFLILFYNIMVPDVKVRAKVFIQPGHFICCWRFYSNSFFGA